MKKAVSVVMLLALVVLCGAGLSLPAMAGDDAKVVGVITKLEDKNGYYVATLKDNKSNALVPVVVKDQLTLDKFKDHRIVVNDEIRCKYEMKDGQNVSKLFRKTAGC